jgi:hypothetical protein
MLSLLDVSGFDSKLEKLRVIFWERRFVLGFETENYLLRFNFCGKKSLGSF